MANLKKWEPNITPIDLNKAVKELKKLKEEGEKPEVVKVPQTQHLQGAEEWNKLINFLKNVKQFMIPKIDYYSINKNTKPSLSKAGAEKICFVFKLVGDYEIDREVFEPGKRIIYYRFKCILRDEQGIKRAEGWGSASNKDTKSAKNKTAIEADNNILKMAKKKALVDAALNVGSLSGDFSQDIETLLTQEKSDHFVGLAGKYDRMAIYTLAKKQLFPDLGNGKATADQQLKYKALVKKAIDLFNSKNKTAYTSAMDDKLTDPDHIELIKKMIMEIK